MLNRFKGIRESLTRTRQAVFGQVQTVLGATEITDETWDDLEALLIQADLGYTTVSELLDRLKERTRREGITRSDRLQGLLKQELRALLGEAPPFNITTNRLLNVMLVVGVNGSGKTTTIGKLARYYRNQGMTPLLVAGDTFRAAAIEQLQIWGKRAGVEVVASKPGADAAAVMHDGIVAARARNLHLVISDTAGRLQTKYNLMQELKKMVGVAARSVHEAPHETLLVLDAVTGQNALSQAKHFQETTHVTGVVLTKLDGTAKGGMVFAIAHDLKLPVRFVGTGEGIEDIAPFDADAFVDGLFEE